MSETERCNGSVHMPDDPLDHWAEPITSERTDPRDAVEPAPAQPEWPTSSARAHSAHITRRTSAAMQVASLALLLTVVAAVVAGRQIAQRSPLSPAQVTGHVTIVSGIGFATVAPTATATFSGPPIGPIPTTCGTSLTFPTVGPPVGGRAVGSGPVWVDGFDGEEASISIPNHATGSYTSHGWPVLIVLAFQHPFSAVVSLDGVSLPTQTPLWFSFQGPNGGTPPSAGFTLDPRHDQNLYPSGDDTAAFWFGALFLPGAGCYTLDAHWNGGRWREHFAAGR